MIRDCLPSASSANAIASCEPMESPSGRACEVIRKRCRAKIASRICPTSASAPAGRTGETGLFINGCFVWARVRGRRGRIAGGSLDPFGADFVEDSLDPIAALDRFVEEEFEARDPLQPQPAADLTPQERRRAAEC